MINLLQKIKNIVKLVSLATINDADDFQIALVDYFGTQKNCVSFTPYGLLNNPPVGSVGVAFSLQSQESNMLAIFDDPRNRTFKDLLSGEVGLSNYISGGYIFINDSGEVHLNGNTDTLIAYTDMKAAFDQLKSDFDNHIHTTTAVTGGGGSPGVIAAPTASTADMSSAEVSDVKVT